MKLPAKVSFSEFNTGNHVLPCFLSLLTDAVELDARGFIASEVIGAGVGILLFCILALHKRRFIVLRRFLFCFASVFLVRCLIMLLTRLPSRRASTLASPRASRTAGT